MELTQTQAHMHTRAQARTQAHTCTHTQLENVYTEDITIDSLPIELIHEIAKTNEAAYRNLVQAYARFARTVTPGTRINYMVHFGHDVRLSKTRTEWLRAGKPHKLTGPAITNLYSNCEQWYRDGLIHREDGPALTLNGRKMWYWMCNKHRQDGPAVIHDDGTQEWWSHGKLHRDDGPAIMHADGSMEWWKHNQRIANQASSRKPRKLTELFSTN